MYNIIKFSLIAVLIATSFIIGRMSVPTLSNEDIEHLQAEAVYRVTSDIYQSGLRSGISYAVECHGLDIGYNAEIVNCNSGMFDF